MSGNSCVCAGLAVASNAASVQAQAIVIRLKGAARPFVNRINSTCDPPQLEGQTVGHKWLTVNKATVKYQPFATS
jgi:hypothetical protein